MAKKFNLAFICVYLIYYIHKATRSRHLTNNKIIWSKKMLKIDFLYRDEESEVHFERFSIRLKDGEFSSIEDCKEFWKYIELSYLFENSDISKVNPLVDRLTSLKDRTDIRFDIRHKEISYDEILRNQKTGDGFTIFFNEDKLNVTFLELEDDDLRSNVIFKEIVKL